MYAWEAIQDSIDFIELNLTKELPIEELANISHLSMYYYQRLFNRLVGKTVNEYIKVRRVAKAKVDIRKTDKKIVEIAFDYGFQSHETFTRSFKEVYAITPEEYRKGTMILTDFLKPDLSMKYTIVEENIPLLVDDMTIEIRKEEIHEETYFTGLSKVCDASEMNKVGVNTLVGLWDEFNQIKQTIPNLLEEGCAIDYFTHAETGKVTYFVGGESTKDKLEGYHQIIMEKGQYYVCAFEAENFEYLVSDALYKANGYFFSTWLVNHNIQMEDMQPFLIQKYLHIDDYPKIEIWIQIVA